MSIVCFDKTTHIFYRKTKHVHYDKAATRYAVPKERMRKPTPLKLLYPEHTKTHGRKTKRVPIPEPILRTQKPYGYQGYYESSNKAEETIPYLNPQLYTENPNQITQTTQKVEKKLISAKNSVPGKEPVYDKVASHQSDESKKAKGSLGSSGRSQRTSPTYDNVPTSGRSTAQSTPAGSRYKFHNLSPGEPGSSDSDPDIDFEQMEAATAHKLIDRILKNKNFEKQLIRKAKRSDGNKIHKGDNSPTHSPKSSRVDQAKRLEFLSKSKLPLSPKVSRVDKSRSERQAIKSENTEYLLRPRFIEKKDLHPMMQPCKDPPCQTEVPQNIFTMFYANTAS